tara:strand:+ start:624 stop:1016 length:393 start_codon:yes stop_codon:yes gene_type:complete
MNYNFEYELTYEKDVLNNNSDDTNYRNDIIHVFHLTEHFNTENINDKVFFKNLSDKANDVYLHYKDNNQIKEMLIKIKEHLRIPFEISDDMLFMYLFRFDLFYLFHRCLLDLHKNSAISDTNFKLLINSI